MSEYEIKTFDKVPEELEEKVTKLSLASFKRSEDPAERENHNDRYCSEHDVFKVLLAMKNNEVLGRIMLFKRIVPYNGKTIVLGGIGGVCTDEKYRRQGIATTMLREGMTILKEQNCDIAYLCTDIYNPSRIKLYGQFGFVLLNKPHTYLGKSGKRYVDTDGMIAPIHSEPIFKQIVETKEPFDIGKGNW
jgi:predicted acetyltransferase